jgi:hypothetical protein
LHAPRRPRPGVRPASRLRPSLARLAPRKTLWHSPCHRSGLDATLSSRVFPVSAFAPSGNG